MTVFDIATPAWRPAATPGQPVKLRMPDGSWRTYGRGGGAPLRQRQGNGSWLEVSTEGVEVSGPYWSQYLPDHFDGTHLNPIWTAFGYVTVSGGAAVLEPWYAGYPPGPLPPGVHSNGSAIELPSDEGQVLGWSPAPPLVRNINGFTVSIGADVRPADFHLQINLESVTEGQFQIQMLAAPWLAGAPVVQIFGGADGYVEITDNLGWMEGAFRLTIIIHDLYAGRAAVWVDTGRPPNQIYETRSLVLSRPSPTSLGIASWGSQPVTILDVGRVPLEVFGGEM